MLGQTIIANLVDPSLVGEIVGPDIVTPGFAILAGDGSPLLSGDGSILITEEA